MYLEAFGVKNLRCLTDTGLVPIKPITLLVGRNSSGKSTFLRAFPLLRQSVETARNSPVLWYDERYVDFGSLQAAANNRLSEPSVTFQFRLRLPGGADIAIGNPVFDIAMTLAGGETPYVSLYEIRVDGHEVRWAFDATGRAQSLIINGRSITLSEPFSLGSMVHFLSNIQHGDQATIDLQPTSDMAELIPIHFYTPTTADQYLLREIITNISPLCHRRVSEEKIEQIAEKLSIGSRRAMLEQLATLSNNKQLTQKSGALALEGEPFESVVASVVMRRSLFILGVADRVLSRVMSHAYYLAPLRVSAQRSYRVQSLAVDEVTSNGENLAMFLRSLSSAQSASFADFTRTALGFETKIETTGIHAEILIKAGNAKQFVNLIDAGFGCSVVLPLAAVLWAKCVNPTRSWREFPPLVAIEQPELHLHPTHQAKLARMLVDAVSSNREARILVETHSESLINAIGKLVHEGLIKAEGVQIVLFDQGEETGETSVRLAGYSENGALHDWPYGFLSPVAERRVSTAAD